MITLKDWEEHCTTQKPLYFFDCNQKVTSVPVSISIAYDKVQETFLLCFSTWNVSFHDIYKTRKECVINAAKKILLAEEISDFKKVFNDE
jgi:hypothetical protein